VLEAVAVSPNFSRETFNLLPGKVLDVQINHPVTVRLKTTLVGYEIGKYIIIKYPKVASSTNYNDVLVQGNVAIVRYLVEGEKGCCFAFRSTIRCISQHPEKFIYLSYPTDIENRELRQHQRVSTNLPAAITLGNDFNGISKITGVIRDISRNGCGFYFIAHNDNIIVNKRDVNITIKQPDNQVIKISASVCNSRNESGTVSVGIKFNENDKQVQALFEQLLIDSHLT